MRRSFLGNAVPWEFQEILLGTLEERGLFFKCTKRLVMGLFDFYVILRLACPLSVWRDRRIDRLEIPAFPPEDGSAAHFGGRGNDNLQFLGKLPRYQAPNCGNDVGYREVCSG